jgi:MerR family transcriptional regulator, light-induced transcriptional regulator
MSSTADPQVLRSLPRTRPGYRGFVAGPGWAEVELPPQIGRLESLEEATDALSAAATV